MAEVLSFIADPVLSDHAASPLAGHLVQGEFGAVSDNGPGVILTERFGDRVKPGRQLVFQNSEKTPLDNQPLPDLTLIDVNSYVVMPVQFSVGCPYRCEFCDIPVIYGQQPRWKSPPRVLRELQAVYDAGFVGTISFVDDNLSANRRALQDLHR